MNGRFQVQGGKNWIFPKEMNANRFFWDSHRLEIWLNHFCPSMGPNGGRVAIDSGKTRPAQPRATKPVFESKHQLRPGQAELQFLVGRCRMGGIVYHMLHMFISDWSALIIPLKATLDSMRTLR